MITETTEFRWRKTKAGDWVVCGSRNHLAHAAETHSQIVVTKRSGEQKAVRIESVGREFGEGLAYGYLSRSKRESKPKGQCQECDRRTNALVECTDESGLPGMCCHLCAYTMRPEMRSFY